MKTLEEFGQWLEGLGKSPGTARMYVSSIRSCKKGKDILSSLKGRKLSASTKVAHRAALRQWATFTEDKELAESLDNPQLKRSISRPGSSMPKRVKPLSPEQMINFRKILDGLKKNPKIDGWVWPALSIFRKLALRAGVDLCQIRKDAAQEALEVDVLQIWTKGGRVREVPAHDIKEELEWLLQYKRWTILADLISPGATEKGRVNAAYKQVSSWLKIIAEGAGINPEDIHSHRFRHTRAVELYNTSKDILAVQKFLGHKNIETTIKYLHVDMTQLAEYLRKLD